MSLLHDAVLRSRSWPVLGGAYRAAYRGAAAVSARALRAVDGIESVYLHRGMTREGWEPGVSDIDLLLVRAPLSPTEERAFLRRLSGRLRTLRKPFPMLGDLWVGEPGEVQNYLRWGGQRAWEDPPDWRLLAGGGLSLPTLAESPEKRRYLDPWVWAFTSYMELCRRVLRAGAAGKDEADSRKLFLDLARYAELAGAPEDGEARLPRSREETKAELPEAGRLPLRALWLEGARRLARASRAVLERVRGSESAAASFPRPAPGGDREALSRALLSGLPAAAGVVIDPPYHSYLLLEEGAAEKDYTAAADALDGKNVPGVPLVLEPATWFLSLQSSYLGAPLGRLDGEPGGADSGLFAGWSATASGGLPEGVPLLPSRLRREVAAEAASWMALWWRYLWIAPGWDDRFVLFHLYTRAMGLRLALAGEPSGPFSDYSLAARSAKRFERHKPLFERFGMLCQGDASPGLGSGERLAWDSEHLETLAELIGACAPSSGEFDQTGSLPTKKAVSALFVGNSLTFHDEPSSPHDLPGSLSRLALRDGMRLETGRLALRGATLERHWTQGRFAEALSGRRWDLVVLQDHSASALETPELLQRYALRCGRAALGAGARILLFSTWLPEGRPGADWERVDEAYRRLGKRLGAPVARVGAAWRAALAAGLPLYAPDGEHAGPLGSYLAACVLYQAAFGLAPSSEGAPGSDLERLRELATSVTRPPQEAVR